MEDQVEKIITRCIQKGECFEWQGPVNRDGYGISYFGKGFTKLVHRRFFELAFGKRLASHELVLHHCDNPRCCAIKHLYKGSVHNNIADRIARNRSGGFCTMDKRGERNPRAKLNWGRVKEIRSSTGTLKQIAAKFKVPWQTVADIRSNRTWKSHDQKD